MVPPNLTLYGHLSFSLHVNPNPMCVLLNLCPKCNPYLTPLSAVWDPLGTEQSLCVPDSGLFQAHLRLVKDSTCLLRPSDSIWSPGMEPDVWDSPQSQEEAGAARKVLALKLVNRFCFITSF